MRLTLRFLALFILLVIATFPNSSSTTTLAEETGNPCFEGCANTEISCRNGCGYDQNCVNKCRDDYNKCVTGCKPLAD
jgi:hypothetical protein